MRKISFGQLTVILFISRIFYTMTFVPFMYNDVTSQVIGFSICTALECLAVIPCIVLYRKYPDKNLYRVAYEKSKILGIIISFTFVFTAILVLNRLFRYFNYFMYVMFPDFLPSWFVVLALAALSFYAAFQGIEAISRSGAIAFGFFALSFIIVAAVIIPDLNMSNLIYTYPKIGDIAHEVYYEFSKCSEILLLPVLYSYAKEKAGKSVYCAIGLKLIFVYLITSICVFALGSYLNISKFPFFDLGSYAETFLIERLDAFLLPAWILTAFIKASLFMFAAKAVLSECFKKVKPNVFLCIIGLITVGLSLAMVLRKKWHYDLFDLLIITIMIIVLGVILPLIFCFVRGDKNDSE